MQHKTLLLLCLLYVGWLPLGILDKTELKCVTGTYINQSRETVQSRHERLLSFNNEEGSLKIELNFAIPFLQIPIGGNHPSTGSSKEGSHPVIDVNTKSLVTAGAFVFAVLFVIPKLLRFILPQPIQFYKGRDSNTQFGSLIQNAESVMSAMNIDVDSCWRRTLCSTIQASSRKVNDSKGSSWDKIIDGLARNDLLQSVIHGSSTHEGIMSGLNDNHCTMMYKSCNFNIKDVIALVRKVTT